MPCLTPSNEEKISEGISCNLQDTIRALEADSEFQECLLGDPAKSAETNVDEKVVEDLIKKLEEKKKTIDLPFIEAQMHKNYRHHLAPSLNGNKQTKEVLKCTKEELELIRMGLQ